MAQGHYGNRNQGTAGQSGQPNQQNQLARPAGNAAPAAAVKSGSTGKSDATFTTGLFVPKNTASKAIGTVQVKEDVLIKAGSYINLFPVDDRKGDASPAYRIQVRDGVLKSPAK